MAGVMVVDTNYGYLSAVFRGGGELILSPLNMTWSPKLANLDIWSHWFSFFFSTFLGGGMVEKVDLEAYRCDFYFSTFIRGGKW